MLVDLEEGNREGTSGRMREELRQREAFLFRYCRLISVIMVGNGMST